ncbi:hypothetical protein [Gramella sp. KN1008]|uniref:hypothetical protein n=1 Tax=Gramella sp. KN1008 TaxID=2529298 RepID=UPI00103B4AEF|nr:hypothetical protein [Gramella sp. KN1008]TBW28098.1 hypothetical protein EZJ28_10255 [Gramella sp. KN1008]
MRLKLLILFILLNVSAKLYSQKKLQRPSGNVGIESIDSVVVQSFNLYEKLFTYKKRLDAGDILNKDELCQIEAFSSFSDSLAKNAIAVRSDLDSESFLMKIRGTIQLQRAKRALDYCHRTSKEIISKKNTLD